MDDAASSEEWPCGVCTFMNAPGAGACDVCGSPAPHASSGAVLPALADPPSDLWACPACTYAGNSTALRSCEICGSSRPRSAGEAAGSSADAAVAAAAAAMPPSGFPDVDTSVYFTDACVEDLAPSYRAPASGRSGAASLDALYHLLSVVTGPDITSVATPASVVEVEAAAGADALAMQSLLRTFALLANDASNDRTRAHAMMILHALLRATLAPAATTGVPPSAACAVLRDVAESLAAVIAHALHVHALPAGADAHELQRQSHLLVAALHVSRDVCESDPSFMKALSRHGCVHAAAHVVKNTGVPALAEARELCAWLLWRASTGGAPTSAMLEEDAQRLAKGVLDGTGTTAGILSAGTCLLLSCASQLHAVTRQWLITSSNDGSSSDIWGEHDALASLHGALTSGEVYTPFQVVHSGIVHALHAYMRVDVRVSTSWSTDGDGSKDMRLMQERMRRCAAVVRTLNGVTNGGRDHSAAMHSIMHACIARVCDGAGRHHPTRPEQSSRVPPLPSNPHWRPWNIFDHVRAGAGTTMYSYAHQPAVASSFEHARLPVNAMLRALSQPLAVRLCGHADDPIVRLLRITPPYVTVATSAESDTDSPRVVGESVTTRVAPSATPACAWVDPMCTLADVASYLMRTLTQDVATTRAVLAHAIALVEAQRASLEARVGEPVSASPAASLSRPRSSSASVASSTTGAEGTRDPGEANGLSSATGKFSVGQRVYTPFRVRSESAAVVWYGGAITRMHDAGASVDIAYDDGDVRVRVAARDVLTHAQLVATHAQLQDGFGDAQHRFADVTISVNRAAALAMPPDTVTRSVRAGVAGSTASIAAAASPRSQASPSKARVPTSAMSAYTQMLASTAAGGSMDGSAADIEALMHALQRAGPPPSGLSSDHVEEFLAAARAVSASGGEAAVPSRNSLVRTHVHHVTDHDGEEDQEEHDEGNSFDNGSGPPPPRVCDLALEERAHKDRGRIVVSDGMSTATTLRSASEVDQQLVYDDVLEVLTSRPSGDPSPASASGATRALAAEETTSFTLTISCNEASVDERIMAASRARAAHAHMLRTGRSTWWMSDYDRWLFATDSSPDSSNCVVVYPEAVAKLARSLGEDGAPTLSNRVALIRRTIGHTRGEAMDAGVAAQRASILASLRRVHEKDDATSIAPQRRSIAQEQLQRAQAVTREMGTVSSTGLPMEVLGGDEESVLSAGTPSSPSAIQAAARALEVRAHELYALVQRASAARLDTVGVGTGGAREARPSSSLPRMSTQLLRADTDSMGMGDDPLRLRDEAPATRDGATLAPEAATRDDITTLLALTTALERDVQAVAGAVGSTRAHSSAPQYVLQRARALLQQAGLPSHGEIHSDVPDTAPAGSMFAASSAAPLAEARIAGGSSTRHAAQALIQAHGGPTASTLTLLRAMLKEADSVAVRGVWIGVQRGTAEPVEIVWGPSMTSHTVMERLGVAWIADAPLHSPPHGISASTAHVMRSHAWDSCSPLERTYTLHFGTLGPHGRQQLPVRVRGDAALEEAAPTPAAHDLFDTGALCVSNTVHCMGAPRTVVAAVPTGGMHSASTLYTRACAALNDAARAVTASSSDETDYVHFARLLHVLSNESRRVSVAAVRHAAAATDAGTRTPDSSNFPCLSAAACEALRVDVSQTHARACARSFSRFVHDDTSVVACASTLARAAVSGGSVRDGTCASAWALPSTFTALLAGDAHSVTSLLLPLSLRVRFFSRVAFGMHHALTSSTTRERLASTGEDGNVFAEYGFTQQQQKAVVSRKHVLNSARTLLGPREVVMDLLSKDAPRMGKADGASAAVTTRDAPLSDGDVESSGRTHIEGVSAQGTTSAVSFSASSVHIASPTRARPRDAVTSMTAVSADGLTLRSARAAREWTRTAMNAVAADVWYALSYNHELAVQFTHEEGHGLGPTLEFYATVARELARDDSLWYPNHSSDAFDELDPAETAAVDSAEERTATVIDVATGADTSGGGTEANAAVPLARGSPAVAAAGDGRATRRRQDASLHDLHPIPLLLTPVHGDDEECVLAPSKEQLRTLQRFEFMGRFAAKALRDQRLFALPLSAPFLRAVMGGCALGASRGPGSDVCVDDLRLLDAALHTSVCALVRICEQRDVLVHELQSAVAAAALRGDSEPEGGSLRGVATGLLEPVPASTEVEQPVQDAKHWQAGHEEVSGNVLRHAGDNDAAIDDRVLACATAIRVLSETVDDLCLEFELSTRRGPVPLLVRPLLPACCMGSEQVTATSSAGSLSSSCSCVCMRPYDEHVRQLGLRNHSDAAAAAAAVRDVLHRTFACVSLGAYDTARVGSGIRFASRPPDVTLWNLHVYIEAVTRTLLQDGIAPHVAAFARGFAVFAPGGVAALNVFSVEEAQALLSGGDTLTDDSLWRADVIRSCIVPAHGYSRTSSQIHALCEVVSELDVHHRRLFLRFITGAARLPHGGFTALTPALTVVRAHVASASDGAARADDALPTCSTCQVYLKLPPYSSKEVLRAKLLLAIQEGQDVFAFD